MKINFYLEYENEKITNFDIAKEIVEICHKQQSYYKLNARKIAQMILIQTEDKDLEHLWTELKEYLEETKYDYCDNSSVLRQIEEMEKRNESICK